MSFQACMTLFAIHKGRYLYFEEHWDTNNIEANWHSLTSQKKKSLVFHRKK